MGDMTVDELKDKKLWFLWSAKPGKNGKVTKVPFAANGGANLIWKRDDALAQARALFLQKKLVFEGIIYFEEFYYRGD